MLLSSRRGGSGLLGLLVGSLLLGEGAGASVRGSAKAASRAPIPEDGMRTLDLKADMWASYSIADDTYRFIANFDILLDQPIYQGWTITLDFDQPIPWISSLEAELLTVSSTNKTLTFGPLFWNRDLKKGRQTQHWQGITSAMPVSLISSTITYNGSITTPSLPDERPIHQEAPPIALPDPVPGEKFNLAKSLSLSILFYEVQRSGKMPDNKRIPWRFDSEMDDKGDDGEDLTGGWHDAGDHIKFGLPMAASVTVLTWGMLLWPDAYEATDQLSWGLEQVKWALDWLIKAHVAPYALYVQVSDKPTDHFVWTRPEDMTNKRKAYKVTCENPGSAPVLEAAAAMAAASILFDKPIAAQLYPGYSSVLLQHAKELFDFGTLCPGDYISEGRVPADCCYGSASWKDEEAWAAAWLYKATQQAGYLTHAESVFGVCCTVEAGTNALQNFDWGTKNAGAVLLLYNITGNATYADVLRGHLDGWAMGTQVKKTPKGLSWLTPWGSNRVAANEAFLALAAAESGLSADVYRSYAKSQVYYILGDCCRDPETGEVAYSYQMGMADKHPRNPHHRATSCDLQGHCECANHASYHVLYGAIVGGPRDDDSYTDKCPDFVYNEVTCDYNAGFQGAVAGLKSLSLQGLLGDETLTTTKKQAPHPKA